MQRLAEFPSKRRFWSCEAIEDWMRRTGRWSSARDASRFVKGLCESGHLTHIRRSLYAAASADDGLPDPWQLPGWLVPDAVLTARTALELRGEIAPARRHKYCIYHSRHPVNGAGLTLGGVTARGLRLPSALENAGMPFVESERLTKVECGSLRIATTARAFVDMLARPTPNGSWREIIALVGTMRPFDLDRAVEYVKRLDNATTAAKTGWVLERHQEQFGVPTSVLDRLTRLRPRGAHYLSRTQRQSGAYFARWKLVVPRDL